MSSAHEDRRQDHHFRSHETNLGDVYFITAPHLHLKALTGQEAAVKVVRETIEVINDQNQGSPPASRLLIKPLALGQGLVELFVRL